MPAAVPSPLRPVRPRTAASCAGAGPRRPAGTPVARRHGALARRLAVGLLLGGTLAACGGGAGADGDGGTGVPVPTSLSLGAPSLTLTSVGGTGTLTATVRDAAGAAMPGATVSWSSDAPAVATASGSGSTGTITARGRGTATITARAGAASASVAVFVRAAFSGGVSPSASLLRVGQTGTLVATVGADDEASRAVRWSSSNSAVAAISPQGIVTAVSPGTTTITVRAESDTSVRAEALVTVVPARSVIITPADLAVGRDELRPLSAQVFVDAGQPTTVTWRTNRPLIATVTQQGVVTGVSDGEATITAIALADTTLRATARVRVVPIVRNLSLSPTTATLNIGQTRSFVARADVDQGANGALTWTSDNPAVASVNQQGLATAVGLGTTTIRVRSVADTTREVTATVTVDPRPVSLTLGTRTLGLLRGAQTTVSSVVTADPGVSTAVRWTSRNPTVASVGDDGRVTALNAGSTHLVAEAVADPTRRDSVNVTIVPQLAAAWTAERLGGPLIEDIVSLWAPSPTLAYAVNSLGDVYRWDGTTWTRAAAGAQFGTSFAAVHGVDADAVTAVGTRGVIVQFNGSAWNAVPSGTQAALSDVWMHTRDTAWAVGADGVALRRTGSAWTTTATNTTARLRAVSGNGREAFAVGDGGVVRRFLNAAWLPVVSPTGETLRDVWAARGLTGDVVIVGDFGTLLRWQEDRLEADPAAGSANLLAVDVSASSGRMVVAGDGIALARTTGDWAELAVPYRTRFSAVALNADGASWIGGQRGLVMRSNWNATAWNTLSLTPDLLDVWSTSATHALAVGELGFIFRYDGASWTRQLAPTLERLNTVWAASPSLAFAGGDNGALLRWNGTAWTAQPSPTGEHIYAMWGASADAVWAVTQGGEVLFWDGVEWAVVHQQTRPLYGVYGTGASDVHAVGLDGIALHYDGTDWTPRATGTNHVLVGLWAGPGERAVTVGARNFTNGVSLRYDGTWQELPSGGAQILSAVWGAIEWDLYAVGDAGTILRYNGTGWSPMPSGTQEFLWAIAGAPGAEGGGFAVGLNGTVLQGQANGAVAASRVGQAPTRPARLEPAPRARTARAAVLRAGVARRGAVAGRTGRR